MSGRKNGIARHPSPCYIGRASAGHCSKPVNNPAGDRTVSCSLLGYRPYSFRCPADLRPVVAATSAEKNSHFETDSVRSPAGVRNADIVTVTVLFDNVFVYKSDYYREEYRSVELNQGQGTSFGNYLNTNRNNLH
ncbi:hypothetical protein MAR_026995 [Mya arenaria]|uniref:Uncharacterized protein n=1 Tax=Mya arenaria TaxID=6604 RepID=A0ABY7ES48_MYAAR|nr:hypothetical protein MAR_026995 [Mya arenaria]